MSPIETHHRHADALRAAATGASGTTEISLRAAHRADTDLVEIRTFGPRVIYERYRRARDSSG